MMKPFLMICIFMVLTCFSLKAQTPASTIPDFNFYTLDNKPFVTKNIVPGKKTLFVFFDANCDHCQRAVSTLGSNYSSLKTVSIYLVSLDSKPVIQTFMSSYGKNLVDKKNVVLLQDLKYQFIPKFQPKKYPGLFLYSSQKKLIIYTNDEHEVGKVIVAAK